MTARILRVDPQSARYGGDGLVRRRRRLRPVINYFPHCQHHQNNRDGGQQAPAVEFHNHGDLLSQGVDALGQREIELR